MKSTTLGIGSWTYPYHCGLGEAIRKELQIKQRMRPLELIDLAVKYQITCVQICENCPLDICSDQELEQIRDYAEEKGVRLEAGMRGATRDNLEKMLDITQKLDASLLRCVIDDGEYEPSLEEIIDVLREILPILKEKNIVLGIENHDRFRAKEFAYVMEQLNDPHFGIVLDTTNSLAQEEPVDEVLRWLAGFTVCLHFKDYTIRRSPGTIGLEIVGTPAGQGRQDIKKILDYVRLNAQQDFSTIIEFWMPPAEDIGKTLKQEDDWAEASIFYLKTLLSS